MSALVGLVWVVQSVVFFLASALALFEPEWLIDLLWTGPPIDHGSMRLAKVSARLLAPLLLGVSLLSSAAALRDHEWVRRDMARCFALSAGVGAAALFLVDHHGAVSCVGIGMLSLACALQAFYGLSPGAEAIPPRLSGTADTKPAELWILWMVQGAGLVALSVALWFAGWTEIAWIVYVTPVPARVPSLAAADLFVRLQSPLCLGIGLFSFHAAGRVRSWHWRIYSGIFAITAGLALLVVLLGWSTDHHRVGAVLLTLPFLAMLVQNARFWWRHHDVVAEDVGRGSDGWTLLDLPTGPLMAIQSIFYKRRSTHLMGVAARGTFRVVSPPDAAGASGRGFPEHAFFRPGLALPVQVRFGTLTSRDDASYDIRGAALRLSDDVDAESPFDMLMNSGAISAPENMFQFLQGIVTRFLPQWVFDRAVRRSLQTREGLIAGRRRAPESYATVHYYSQTVRFWVTSDDVRYLVRYRLLDPTRPETGLADAEDEARPWVRERRKDEKRPSDYLRAELKQRLAEGHPVALRFQAQFHRPQPGDTVHWYNASVDWPSDHPWVDVAEVTLTATLRDEEAERLCFNPDNHPPSLGVPAATSIFDYRSLADSERRVIRKLQRYRLLMYRAFGLPRFGDTLPRARGGR